MKKNLIIRLLPLYGVIFIGFLGYALTISLFIPMIMDPHLSLVSINASTAVRSTLSGFLLAMYPLGQFFGSPVIGALSDRIGRKKILLLSLLFCSIGFIGMALSIWLLNLPLLMLASFFTGLCESNMAISQSIISDEADNEKDKTKLIAYAYSACSLGYIIGPLLSSVSAETLSYSFPFFLLAICVACLIIYIQFFFKEKFIVKEKTALNLFESFTSIGTIFSSGGLKKAYLINFLIFFSVQGLYRIIPLYVVDRWHPSLQQYSLIIAVSSIICFMTNLLILDKLTMRLQLKSLLKILLSLGGVLVFIILIPSNFNSIWFTFGAAVIPTVMALPVCTSLLSQQAPVDQQGQVLGNNQALLVLGEASSASIGGALSGISAALPIVLVSVILIGLSLSIRAK